MKFRPLWLKLAATIMALVVVVALLLCLFSELNAYKLRTLEEAATVADSYTERYADAIEDKLDSMMKQVKAIAIKLPENADSIATAAQYLNGEESKVAWITGIRYVANDELYSGFITYEGSDSDVVKLYQTGREGIIGFVNDTGFVGTTIQCVVFGVPVGDNAAGISYMLVYCQSQLFYDQLENITETTAAEQAEILYFCSNSHIYRPLGQGEAFLESPRNNAFDMMLDVGVPATTIDSIKSSYTNRENTSGSFDIAGDDHAYSLHFIEGTNSSLALMGFYRSENVIFQEALFADMIFALAVALTIVVIAAIAFAVYCYLHKGEREAIRQLDPVAKCNAYDYYAALSQRTVHSSKYPHYAVISLKVHYYNYYFEQYGEEFCKETVQFVAKSIDRCLQNDEIMGYRGEGEFAITMHYADDNELIGRIKLLHAILISCPPVVEKGDKLRTACGIYPVSRHDNSLVESMVEKAAIAIASKNFDINAVYSFYTDETSVIVQRETEMERKMRQALKDGSFRIFYQPKYSVEKKGVDGAEALIRWYDAETGHYYYPADFLRLFEENGFVVEMDKFVLRQVATLLSDLTARRQKVVPISVNISRVTAAQKDFVDFCMKLRQEFQIPNELLTFEFNESFAHYDYDALRRTLEVLEGRGFVCSIDGYGAGYSSYSILKELKFTEIKLDKFFLRKSSRPERDREVLGDVIALARKLGLRVVQEGVETEADFNWLIEQGCEVIQGFYYSKPLGLQDFIDFINKTELYGLGEIPGKKE